MTQPSWRGLPLRVPRCRPLLVVGAVFLAACGVTPTSAPTPAPTPTSPSPAPAAPPAPAAVSPALAGIIAAAQQEKTVRWALDPSLGSAVSDLQNLVGTLYSVDLTVDAVPEQNESQEVGQVVTEIKDGESTGVDLLDLSDASLAPILENQAAYAVDWSSLLPNAPGQAVVQGVLLDTRDEFFLPAYNTQVIPPDRAPRSYDDLLASQWHGQISLTTDMTQWAWLAQPNAWGEQRLDTYMASLIAEAPVVEDPNSLLTHLLSGAYPIASGLNSGPVWLAQREQRPIAQVPVTPVHDIKHGAVIPADAGHPHAAILLALAEATPQGQAILDRVSGQTAAWIADTASARFAEETTTVVSDPGFVQNQQAQVVQKLNALIQDGSRG